MKGDTLYTVFRARSGDVVYGDPLLVITKSASLSNSRRMDSEKSYGCLKTRDSQKSQRNMR